MANRSYLTRLLKNFSNFSLIYLMALAAGDCPESWHNVFDTALTSALGQS
ncbi:MAG: hypothetical protein Q7S87_16690 [Agitococcus sp.]|nr:hypothetical protein [Agitococcus sp.]